MGTAKALEKLAENQPLLLGAGVLAVVLIVMASRAAKAGADLIGSAGTAIADGVATTVDAAGGVLTGNNTVTQSATNAAGDATTAYQGAGIVGTVGAATNAVSGGVLASMGEAIGGKLFDWFGPSVDLTNRAAPANGTITTKPGAGQAQGYTTGMPS
jgi:hypothetical protein